MNDQLKRPTNTALSDEERYNNLPYHKRTWFRVLVVVLPQVITILQIVIVQFIDELGFVLLSFVWLICCVYIFRGESKTDFGRLIKNFILLVAVFFSFLLILLILNNE